MCMYSTHPKMATIVNFMLYVFYPFFFFNKKPGGQVV